MTEITPSQYADKKQVSLSYVCRLIREKRAIPDVLDVKSFGRFYILYVKDDFLGKIEEKKKK